MNTITLEPEAFPSGGDVDGRVAACRIQAAIDRMHAGGGGRVTLSAGDWVCATVFLRSGVELHLEHGARLVADPDMSHYTPAPHGWSDTGHQAIALLVASGCTDVVLSGKGTVDGSAMAFLEPCETEGERLHGIFRFTYKRDDRLRCPFPLIQIAHSRDVVVRDINIVNSPGWTLHLYDCDHALVSHVVIRNNRLIPYSDGIGIDASRDVLVTDCDVETGDDAIIVKATHPALTCERVTVSHCVAASNCSAFGLGADAPGTIRDVEFGHCVATRSLRMIQVEQWYPGVIERVVFDDISGRTFPDEGIFCERPIYVDIQQWTRPEKALGKVRDLVFRNIRCETRGRMVFTAQDGSRIEGVTLDHVRLHVPEIEDPAVTVPAARSMQLSNFSPVTRAARAAVVADNVAGLSLRDLHVAWPERPAVPMHAMCLRRCSDVQLDSPRLTPSVPELSFWLTPE